MEWKQSDVTIDGGFSQSGVSHPASWSALAVKIAASKYLYGDRDKGDDPRTGGRERSIENLVSRVCSTIARWGVEGGYLTEDNARTFEHELSWLCLHQYGAFNSPVWFNVGLDRYGLTTSHSDHWGWDHSRRAAVKVENQFTKPQGSACFIQSVGDTLKDIMRLACSEATLFAYGSGTGTDLSPIRSTRDKLSGGGRPSGPLSFLTIYDAVAGTIQSGGKTRRAAKLNTLRDWHPDIEEFIVAKTEEEKKAHTLISGGYDADFNGPAYATVKFQNENLSVRISDKFMECARNGTPWFTRFRDGSPCESKDAHRLLRMIAKGSHFCGDPGVIFDDTVNKWHTCKASGPINASNPCVEYHFLDDTACNLASLNLVKFLSPDGTFDAVAFEHAVDLFILAQEILVDNVSYPTKQIAENSHTYRTLGLGYANLGSLLMHLGMPYDSDDGRGVAAAITALMTGRAYRQSAAIAACVGAFDGAAIHDGTKSNSEYMREVLYQHAARMGDLGTIASPATSALHAARRNWEAVNAPGTIFRNAQVTVLAPTGTIGFMMDCDTTGIEPEIALVRTKTLAGGGTLKLTNRAVRTALIKLGYESSIQEAVNHILTHNTAESVDGHPSPIREEHWPIFTTAFAGGGKKTIHYTGHLRMMAAVQPFLSGAISKTVNLPEEITVDEMVDLYFSAWNMGLKAVAVYRDGSKKSAPIETKSPQKTVLPVSPPVRVRMPETRNSLTHKFDIAGQEGYITVGMFDDGRPGELFIMMSKEGTTISGLLDTIGTLTSVALQYGVPLENLVHKFSYQRFEPSGFTTNAAIKSATSVIDYIFRWLGDRFLVADVSATPALPYMDKVCSNCGSHRVVRTGTCGCCEDCGTSAGCS